MLASAGISQCLLSEMSSVSRWHYYSVHMVLSMALGAISIHILRSIFLHDDACYSPAPNSSCAPGPGKPCESISSKRLIITHISPFIYIPTWTNKQNKEILPGQINCFTRCSDLFANLGWPPKKEGSIQPDARKQQRYLSSWHHQFNLVQRLDESVAADMPLTRARCALIGLELRNETDKQLLKHKVTEGNQSRLIHL